MLIHTCGDTNCRVPFVSVRGVRVLFVIHHDTDKLCHVIRHKWRLDAI